MNPKPLLSSQTHLAIPKQVNTSDAIPIMPGLIKSSNNIGTKSRLGKLQPAPSSTLVSNSFSGTKSCVRNLRNFKSSNKSLNSQQIITQIDSIDSPVGESSQVVSKQSIKNYNQFGNNISTRSNSVCRHPPKSQEYLCSAGWMSEHITRSANTDNSNLDPLFGANDREETMLWGQSTSELDYLLKETSRKSMASESPIAFKTYIGVNEGACNKVRFADGNSSKLSHDYIHLRRCMSANNVSKLLRTKNPSSHLTRKSRAPTHTASPMKNKNCDSSATSNNQTNTMAVSCSEPKLTLKMKSAPISASTRSQRLLPTTDRGMEKGMVDQLLQSDALYQAKIQNLKAQLNDLENLRVKQEKTISRLRKELNGVNAVQENDLVVAHCSAIMQQRLTKAEEEYMKAVANQTTVKQEIDTIRMEITPLEKIKKKLIADINTLQKTYENIQVKIYASRKARIRINNELAEIIRQFDLQVELHQPQLSFDNEKKFIDIDAEKLTKAAYQASTAISEAGKNFHPQTSLPQSEDITSWKRSTKISGKPSGQVCSEKKLLLENQHKKMMDMKSVLEVLESQFGKSFLDEFEIAENTVLSKYKAMLALEEEINSLNKEVDNLSAIATRNKSNQAELQNISLQKQADIDNEIIVKQDRKLQYSLMSEDRIKEQQVLQQIILRCLNIVEPLTIQRSQKPKVGDASDANEPSLVKLLESLQTTIMETLIKIQLYHNNTSLSETELPVTNGRICNETLDTKPPFAIGPRSPSGLALTSILSAVQTMHMDTTMKIQKIYE